MRERVCKNCGGRKYSVVGQNMVKCMFCGTLYVDEHASKEEEVLTVGAYEKLRECDFVGAIAEFDKILSFYPLSFESLFGKALAKNKIILYPNKRGGALKKPRFFGDEITSIQEDEDFKKAVENAPAETAKTYNDTAKRIEKIRTAYLEQSKDFSCDVLVYAMEYEKDNPENLTSKTVSKLRESGLKVFFAQEQKEKEEESFLALKTCKVMVFFANSKSGYTDGDCRQIFDRYSYFVSQKKKTKSGLILAIDNEKISLSNLPKQLSSCKSVLETTSSSFLQNIEIKVKKELQNSVVETAKIDTVKIEKVEPQKKEYVDIESVFPTELGHYQVENLELSEANKIKWIFLTLKNGDFSSARELIDKELANDPNSAELQFADLLTSKNIKTQEEFFSNISNFGDKEKIENILKFASKDFAESFVDSWENLIIRLDSEEYYNAFLLYLAKFNSPNRDNFITHAENKAVETMNEELIDKVLKCFGANEVERFVQFYFMLAQKSDNQEYYQKILEIDEGHEQSNLAVLLQHFKTDEDKLNYHNKEEIEEVFKYLGESTRSQFVGAVVNMIIPIAFYDVDKAQEQLDFYLSYVSQEQLVGLLKTISNKFLEMNFFKPAEKYLTIAISKDKNDAGLYWQLIKIKAHCKTDNELIMSSIKITQLPEWETLISLADEEQTEKFAEIASKINLYAGERLEFRDEMLDKKQIAELLTTFLDRNNKILLEMEKQEGVQVLKGVRYYRSQLKPFENYIEQLQSAKDFQTYEGLLQKLNTRLDAMNLTLDASINVVDLQEKEEGLKTICQTEPSAISPKPEKKKIKDIKKDTFLKRFLYIFLELFPLLFTTLLLTILIFLPKEVYMYFSQEFLVVAIIVSMSVGMINLVVYVNTKEQSSKGWNMARLALFCIGILNLILLCLGFYVSPKTMEIKDANELQTLMHNASYSNLKLEDDIDLSGTKWKNSNFSGSLDGNGHKITNLEFASQKQIGFVGNNSGTIKNLTLELKEKAYSNVSKFGVLAVSNYGTIKNCKVSGILEIETNIDAVLGGISGEMTGGEIDSCLVDLKITLTANSNVNFGGVVGKVVDGNVDVSLTKNESFVKTTFDLKSSRFYCGGLVGNLQHFADEKIDISQNHSDIVFVMNGNAANYIVGGLVGQGNSSSKNNYATGAINAQNLTGNGLIGGIYGQYDNTVLTSRVEYSYSNVKIDGSITAVKRGLVAGFGGNFYSCFSAQEMELAGTMKFSGLKCENCLTASQLSATYYDSRLGFDTDIWQINESAYPTLK